MTAERFADPVDLPARFKHGGSTAYQKYGCRCGRCVRWRRTYDRRRWRRVRAPQRAADRAARKAQERLPGGWYVCVGLYGVTYPEHRRVAGTCVNCRGKYDFENEESKT